MAEVTATQPLAVQLQRAFQMPGSQRIGWMLTMATIIAVIVAGYMWSQTPDYRVLYGNLPERDGGSVMTALQQMNIPYKFGDGGALLVPGDKIHEVRLRLAAQGLPKGGLVGFEVMEGQKFGTSQFAEQINYQRALEGELARSIQSLAAVQAARVHLALSRSSAFLREQAKPSASVLLNLYPGRTLDDAQVSAVVHLVANSVPDLQAKSVSVVDQNGRLLSADDTAGKPGMLDPGQLAYRRELEQSYNTRIEAILAPVTGNTNVRAQVTADLDFSESEHAEEIYKPNQNATDATMRSQQNSESVTPAGGASGAGGVPGALSNQPPSATAAPVANAPPNAAAAAAGAAAAAAASAPSANTRKDTTINYEVDKTIRHTRQELGRIKRLAAAVVVNNKRQVDAAGKVTYVPLKEAELTQITDLVKEVLGYNKERGDTVSVINSAFTAPDVEKIEETPLWKQPDVIETAKMIGKNLLIAGVLLFVVMGVLRPMLKSYSAALPVHEPMAEAHAAAGGMPPQLMQPAGYEQHVDNAKQIARRDPKIVANVVKEWVSSDGK